MSSLEDLVLVSIRVLQILNSKMEYVNISDSGTAIPAIYIAKPDVTGTNAYDIKFIRSRNYTLTDSNAITTAEMSTGSFVVELSFRYRCTSSTTLRQGASID